MSINQNLLKIKEAIDENPDLKEELTKIQLDAYKNLMQVLDEKKGAVADKDSFDRGVITGKFIAISEILNGIDMSRKNEDKPPDLDK